MSNNSIIEHRANYHFVALREEYLLICQQCKYKKPDTAKSKNKASMHCKALILDVLEHWTNTKRDRRESLAIYMTYEQWSDAMYGMFGRNVIIDSLDELIGEGLIAREPYKMYGKKTFQYYLNYQDLNRRMKGLPEKAPDKLLPEKEAFISKREKDDTRLQVNSSAFTNKPVTRLQVNEDAFTSNHNLDTTQIQNPNSAERKKEPTPSISQSTLSSDLQMWFEEVYCQSKIGRVVPDIIDEIFKQHLIKIMQHTKTVEELNSLYDYVQQKIIEAGLKDQTVYPGNLANKRYLAGWLQAKERPVNISLATDQEIENLPEAVLTTISKKVGRVRPPRREWTGGDC